MPAQEKLVPALLRTLPGDDVRQILWRFADRYDLQMLVHSVRAGARGPVARLVADPYLEPLSDWGASLHDQLALPTFLDEDLRGVLRAQLPAPAGGLMFSCNGRGTRMFSAANHEYPNPWLLFHQRGNRLQQQVQPLVLVQ